MVPRPFFDVAGPTEMHRSDRIMLCSDGLWSSVSETVIARELANKSVSRAIPDLIDAALRKAGATSDNVTAVAMEWEMPGAERFESDEPVSDTLPPPLEPDAGGKAEPRPDAPAA